MTNPQQESATTIRTAPKTTAVRRTSNTTIEVTVALHGEDPYFVLNLTDAEAATLASQLAAAT